MLKENAKKQLVGGGLGHVADAILECARPAIRIVARAADSESMVGQSKFGGVPDLPAQLEWPKNNGRPLDFLAQISLAEVAAFDVDPSIPKSGYLWFFYDNEAGVWGFDPEDRGGWAVLYSDAASSDSSRPLGESNATATFEQRAIDFFATLTLPSSFGDRGFDLQLSESEEGRLDELLEDRSAESAIQRWGHHLCGWPHPVQNDCMELECAGASCGCNMGSPEGYELAQERGLLENADDWTLLLQLDSDEQGPGWMWGDSGVIYFWIRTDHLQQRRFDKAWLVLQCF